MSKEATEEMEARIGDLLDAFNTKKAIRDVLTDWHIHYITTKKLTQHEVAKSIRDFRNLFEFFR